MHPTRSALLLSFVLSVAVFAQDAKENVAFKWAFGAITGPKKVFVPISRDTTLLSGDDVKMYVTLDRSCFVYVIHAGPSGEITLFFPYSLKQFDADYTTGKNYYVPKGRDWVHLDKTTGKETFYLLASAERLTKLEDLLGAYQKADPANKADASQAVRTEINDVRKRFRTFTTFAEKPVTIGGNIRGVGESVQTKRPDVADIATAVSAANFYAKTVTIDHR